MSENKKFIKDAIVWCKEYWLRASDLNLIPEKRYGHPTYVSPYGPNVKFHEAYPYEDWMEEYIGTNSPEVINRRKKD